MSDAPIQDSEDLAASRQEHHREILGSTGYPDRYDRTHVAGELHERFSDLEPGTVTSEQVSVAGRLMLHRSFGKLQFGTLRDVSCTIQLFVDRAHVGAAVADEFDRADLGDWLGAEGVVMTTRKGELSVKVDRFVILQKSLRPLPDKFHGLQDVRDAKPPPLSRPFGQR